MPHGEAAEVAGRLLRLECQQELGEVAFVIGRSLPRPVPERVREHLGTQYATRRAKCSRWHASCVLCPRISRAVLLRRASSAARTRIADRSPAALRASPARRT